MNDLSSVRFFRLSSGGIECDEAGLRVGDVALLAQNAKGAWGARDERELGRDLQRVYGFPVDAGAKMAGFAAVANALQGGNIAKAQIAALLLRLPDPLPPAGAGLGKSGDQRLFRDLVACGLLKADADWDERHPRTGTPPNPGWFASKPTEARTNEASQAGAKPDESGSSHSGASGAELALLPRALATATESLVTENLSALPAATESLVADNLSALPAAGESLLAEDLSATAVDGLATLAARFSVPAALFGAIFIPSANRLVDEGPVPGRPDMTYRWARDEQSVTFKALVDGQWRPLTGGRLGQSSVFYSEDGDAIARIVSASGRPPTLVTSVDVLDRALADRLRANGQPAASPTEDDNQPKLCPDPTPEPKTTQSQNSIDYQEYVSGLPYGWAIEVGGVVFDGCDESTGNLLEAKAKIDFMFDGNNVLFDWVKPENNPTFQMETQAETARAAGRLVVWHAQTLKGFLALSNIADNLDELNLFVVYDPK